MQDVNASLDAISAFILKSLFISFYLRNEQAVLRLHGVRLYHRHEDCSPDRSCLRPVFLLFPRYRAACGSGCLRVMVCLSSLLALSFTHNKASGDFVYLSSTLSAPTLSPQFTHVGVPTDMLICALTLVIPLTVSPMSVSPPT
jgi:hypothetical protein